ncbi:CCD18-like protein [Mya arenaria]|uniref:CCD18-like protein n=1 Tax=Mya arenaria TaxID=6604 RepID=A0ABY7GAP2_MYAAR|nr:CCD18-like protein [Mya arenaria]
MAEIKSNAPLYPDHVSGNMSSSDTAPPHLLMRNVRDIRKRLMETEKTLNKISKAEAKVDNNDDIDDLISLTSQDSRRHLVDFRVRDEEDRESIKSDLATLPDSSYAGFERIRFLKEANKKVLIQNQKLMNEVEKTSIELQASRAKVRELSYELDEFRQSVPDLEDKILGLQAENESQEKALSLETQSDEAMQNFLEAQDTLRDYQRKTKDRLKKYEETEDSLRDSLTHANREREELLERLAYFQTRLEADSQLLQSLQFENRQLRSENDAQQDQLAKCQQEIEESRTMLTQLEQLAQQVQNSFSRPNSRNNSFSNNDSGNFSLRNPGDMTQASLQKSATAGAESNTATAKNILSDLRLKLAMKDSEIERLKASQQERQAANDQSELVENLRTDLNNMIERNQRKQSQELDAMVTRLEGERDRLLSQVKIREKTRQISEQDEQLQEKTSQCSHQASKIKQFEAEIAAREEEAQSLHRELREKQGGADVQREERERVQKIHQEQCKDYQKQIDILQERVENKSSQANEWEKQTDILRREISDKSHRLYESEQALARTQKQLESQARDGTSQIKQMEAALQLCKDEIKTYIGALEETKQLYEKEIEKRDEKIKHLNHKSKVLGHELEVKSQECEQYEKEGMETQVMMEHSLARIQDLEETQAHLQKHVSKLEHELLTGNSQWLSDQQSLETKLKQACEDLETRTLQVRELSATLKSLEDERNRLSSEVDLLDTQLQDEQGEHEEKSDRISRLERDNRDLRVQLEQKIELVTDFEDQLQQKTADMEQQLQLDLHEENCVRIANLEKQLDRAVYNIFNRSVQEELSERKHEVEELRALLDERQSELDGRVSLVGELEQTIQEQHQEMERRIQRLDTTVRKHEVEVQERTKQISDLDDRLQQTQSQLREVTLQHQQGEQLCNKQQMELHSKTAKLQELENSQECDTARLAEELGAAKARQTDAETKRSAEVHKLSDEQEDLERQYHSELSALREEIADYREANDILKAQLKDKTRQLGEMEQHYADQVNIAAQELDTINDEMETRKVQMESSNEQLILKVQFLQDGSQEGVK